MIKTIFNRVVAIIEFIIAYVTGKVFGISFVVRYLRNPNPLVTVRLLRSFGATIGERTTFKRSLFIDNSYEDECSSGDFKSLKVGKNCYIGDNVFFDLTNEIIIEDNAVVSGHVSFITHADCNRSAYLKEKFPRQCEPIKIEQGAWIGFNVTILAGITLGAHAVVSANSLLITNVEAETLYAGTPAVKKRSLNI